MKSQDVISNKQNKKGMKHLRAVPFFSFVSNLIYPPVCGICGKINQDFLCNKCQKYLESQAKFQIQENMDISYYFEKHLYIFEYQGTIRKLIIDYKFNEKPYLYKTIVNFLLKNEKFFKILKSYDTIVPVPISKKRMKQRGYNQSELIAKEIARNLKIEYNKKSLIKTKDIIEQSKLKKDEREKNIRGVYELKNSKLLENKKILLIDDVYTTGSTVNECCKNLNSLNIKNVHVLTLAKD